MLSVKDVSKIFSSGLLKQNKVEAVKKVNLSIDRGKTLGIVGKSGCGKTTLGKLITRLIKPTEGKIFFKGIDITELNIKEFSRYRPKLQMIFQNPETSLNPRMKIRDCLIEGLKLQGGLKAEKDDKLHELLEVVNLRREILDRYPHEISGGEIQRVVIARVLSLDPELIVADEPTSNLDISVQAQILNLLKKLQDDYKITYIFISHNLEVIKNISDRIAVMLEGEIIEQGPAKHLVQRPSHAYTRKLVSCTSY